MIKPHSKKVELETKSKVISWLKVYAPIIAIFSISLAANIVLFNWRDAPVYFSQDSQSYIDVARQLRGFHLPDFSLRTPIYPLYITLFLSFKRMSWLAYGQIILGALTSIFFYLIIAKLIKIRWLSFLIAFVLMLDYQVILFQSMILTETLASFLLMLSLYLHITLIKNETRVWFFILMIIVDLLFVYIRPNFLVISIALYVINITYYLIWERKNLFFKRGLVALSLGIIIISGSILIYSYANYRVHGFFGPSRVSGDNILAKIVQYKYINPNKNYADLPPLPTLALDVVKNEGPDRTYSGKIINQLKANSLYNPKNVAQINSYFLKGKKVDFIRQTLLMVPGVFVSERVLSFYTNPNPALFTNEKAMRLFNGFDKIFNGLNRIKWLGFWLGIISCLILLWRKKQEAFGVFFMIIVVTLTNILVFVAFSPGEYARYRMPTEWLINLLILSPILLAAIFWQGINKKDRLVLNNEVSNNNN